MQLQEQFSREQLIRIIDQSLVFECACSAQVCRQLLVLSELFDYQVQCIDRNDLDKRVHHAIAEGTRSAYTAMEGCLAEVLDLEGWDRETLTRPVSLDALG